MRGLRLFLGAGLFTAAVAFHPPGTGSAGEIAGNPAAKQQKAQRPQPEIHRGNHDAGE